MKDLKIIDIKKTPQKEALKDIEKKLKIAKHHSLLDYGTSIKLTAYINPKTNPLPFSIIRKVSNHDDLSNYKIRKIGAYLCFDEIEEMMTGRKVKLPA